MLGLHDARVSDEFIYASQEAQISILQAFNDGFANKLAKGFDLMAIHGINPRTGSASDIINTNCFDKKVTQTVELDEADPDLNVESAIGVVQGADGVVTGLGMDPQFATTLAKFKVNGVKQFPELSWGANPDTIKGLKVDANRTISNGGTNRVILGDFQSRFKWGYAKQIPMEIIRYGDPDNTGQDLKGYNQVYLRAEAYIGWGIMQPEHFAIIKAGE